MHDDGLTINELFDQGKLLVAIGRNPPPVRVNETTRERITVLPRVREACRLADPLYAATGEGV